MVIIISHLWFVNHLCGIFCHFKRLIMFFFFDSENYCVNDIIERMKSIKPLKEIIEQTGISQSAISMWKSRNTFPRSDDLYKISCCLKVSMEYLLTGKDFQSELTQDETELLHNYRLLSDDQKSMLQIMVSAIASKADV